ncbi:MAG TPA: virulence RhuM family protein [Leptospiraceae bacterium]|nr:virulence RhuM family protein [Leptospiraceae bacterium]HMW07395.1 virulence RhuM family protein [Leptospiraceae bacterium]HMX35344.1 virulence RhuM family protein [Leptospiraceae bacterium]HMY32458.1 virulence RhuM family protein [Leptospiraceae bacterium]HNA08466.1 virulence RhuM family protein [Leptospiraceae bacterium]
MSTPSEIILFKTADEKVSIQVIMEDETVWLTQEQISQLFERDRSVITKHIGKIFREGELDERVVCANFALTTPHGAIEGKTQEQEVKHYNLDVIISVGYRVKSLRGTEFRKWATQRLKEYIIKGFTMDDERLKGAGGGNYWKELLERIRDIRSSEKVIYRQVLDLYATSIDYNSKSKESVLFFKMVQNKLHYAVNKQTAAELIYNRADAEKEFMGLTNFSGALPTKKDISIAKNYLNKDELGRLNRLVSAFFDLAEMKAMEQTPMKMKDWLAELDKFTSMYGKGTLQNSGTVSNEKAIEKAESEYKKYQVKTISPVEEAYLDTIKNMQKKIEKKAKK